MYQLAVLISLMALAGAGGSYLPPEELPEVEGLSAASLARDKAAFLKRCPDYGYKGRVDRLYSAELGTRIKQDDGTGGHYIDWTAAGLYANSVARKVSEDLQASLYGNPHSLSTPSLHSSLLVEQIRGSLMQLFGADPKEYELVFTRSATDALHLIGDAFAWHANHSAFLYTVSNHNSVIGMREYACGRGARVGAVEETHVEPWLAAAEAQIAAAGRDAPHGAADDACGGLLACEGPPVADWETGVGGGRLRACHTTGDTLYVCGDEGNPVSHLPGAQHAQEPIAAHTGGREGQQDRGRWASDGEPATVYSLFAYPAYDNYAGVIYPLEWVKRVQGLTTTLRNGDKHKWLVLVDTAAYVPHHPLNLTEVQADFAVVSFYKLFGLPTGVGALLVRRQSVSSMTMKYFAGGAVFTATAGLHWHAPHALPLRMELGTLPFLEIISLKHGLDALSAIGGVPAIHAHTQCLADWLHAQLSALKHPNGKPMVRIIGAWPGSKGAAQATDQESDTKTQTKHSEQGRESTPWGQGPTINFLVLGTDGQPFSHKVVGVDAARHGIWMRWGCMCNPGACYRALGFTDVELATAAIEAARQHPGSEEWEEAWEWLTVTRPDPTSPNHTLTLRIPTGSVRASLGWGSRFEDAHALVSFIHKHYSGRHSNASSMESLRLYEAEQSTGGEAPGRGSSGSRRMGPVIQMGQDVDWLRKRLVYNRAGGC